MPHGVPDASSKRRRRFRLGTVALLGVAVASWLALPAGDPTTRPLGTVEDVEGLAKRTDVNLLFILIDTLRADRLGGYGYRRETSPLLDHLAAGGVRFANHLSQSSWTKCSMASLWSGLYPSRTGITRFDHVLPEEALLPAEILREAGFRTTALYRNGWVAPYFGFAQGFEVYDRPVGRGLPATVRRDNPTVKEGGSDADLLDAAREFLRVHGKERWFLYLHMMDVHEYIYDEETARFGSSHSDVYDNSILRVNLVLNRLLGDLSQAGHLEDTVVAVASDHGEAFGERGIEGHARFVYRETTEVPLIFHFPFRLDPGVVIERRTQNVDVWPTLLDLLGLPPLADSDGRSRVPDIIAAMRPESGPPPEEKAFAHLDTTWGRRELDPAPTVAVSEGRYRFITVPPSWGRGPPQEELFDRATDPGELRDLIDSEPEVASRMRQAARAYLENTAPPWGVEAETLELDEMQLNQLRALGYRLP
jgi:arylsulfatase A-like enzyme